MKYEIRMSADMKTMTIIYHGEVGLEDLLSAQKDRIKDLDAFSAINFMVHDYTEADMTPLLKQRIHEITANAEVQVPLNPELIVISIMPDDLAFRLGRTAQAYAAGIPWTTHVVRAREESEKLIKRLSR